jgi:hypothetical protein
VKEKILARRSIYVTLAMVLILAAAVLLWQLFRREQPIIVSPVLVEKEPVRVLDGPDADAIYMQLRAGEPNIVRLSRDHPYGAEGEVAVLVEGFPTHMSPGNPLLPYKALHIAIPPYADPATLEVDVTRRVEEEIPGTYRVAPAPPRISCQETPSEERDLPGSEEWGEG